MINKKLMIAIWIVILGLYSQPILAQAVTENLTAENLTPVVHTLNLTAHVPTFAGLHCTSSTSDWVASIAGKTRGFVAFIAGEQCNNELNGNLIIIENEGKNKNITVSFTNLIERNSSQILDKSKINFISGVLNKDQSNSTINVNLSGYGVWVGEMSVNTKGIESGIYDGKAIIEEANSTPLELNLSVELTPPLLPKWFVLAVAAALIIISLVLIINSEDKDPTWGIILSILPIVGGTVLLYLSPLSDPTGNTLLNLAFFAPMATYIIDFLKKRRDDRLALEKSVADDNRKAIGDAIKFHSALLEELNAHGATFSYIDGVGADRLINVNGAENLDDKAWNDGKATAVMVSELPGYRLARYYQYIADFNKYLKAIKTGEASLNDPTKFEDLCKKFDNLNGAFKELEYIVYANIYYNIGSFQYRFRSFKEFEVPFHLPNVLLKYFTENLGIAKEKINDDKIYNEKMCMELMKEIEKDFKERFKKLQDALLELSKITIKKESAYLFSWDEIPGNDSVKLIEFLKQNFKIDWVKKDNIKKSEDGKTISASAGNNNLSLILNDEKTKVNLKIDNGRTNELNARTENSKLNIYWTEPN
jgi:hypothetical protein